VSRLAFFSPLPPAATGVADYAADVLAVLSGHHEIDVFHDQHTVDRGRLPPPCGLHHAASFDERRRRRPYDLAIYQMGNSEAHAFEYEPLARAGGLLVLHDLVLHHSRARAFLDAPEVVAYRADPSSAEKRSRAQASIDRYRAEVSYCYPEQADRLVDAHLETTGRLLPYAYPLFRLPVEASRVVAAHNGAILDAVRREVPDAAMARIAMPIARANVSRHDVAALRERHGLRAGQTVVATFGLLTREKETDVLARAVARAAVHLPGVHLLLVGPTADEDGLRRRLGALGLVGRATVTGRVPFAALAAYAEASDIVVHLRYPTARETSASLLRVLAQGRATVISDLENFAEIPDGAVVRVRTTDEEGEVLRAVHALASDPARLARLGRNAAAYVEAEHSAERCRETYEHAIALALRRPPPGPHAWPAHWPLPAP
jgi:glycosyltransferase involved in cell wall biosynthesis